MTRHVPTYLPYTDYFASRCWFQARVIYIDGQGLRREPAVEWWTRLAANRAMPAMSRSQTVHVRAPVRGS